MKLSTEITMYPLQDKYLPIIENFIHHLKSYKGITLEVFPTSTVVMGDFDVVMQVISSSIKWSADNKDKAVFVAKFLPNYETGGQAVTFQDMANATLNNTSNFATKFLETIACNRAFVRCVRNFLNVHIVGDDEIDKSNLSIPQQNSQLGSLTPYSMIELIQSLNRE